MTLPHALMDAKIGNIDDDFFVLAEGEEIEFKETKTSTECTLSFTLKKGIEEVEIIGIEVPYQKKKES